MVAWTSMATHRNWLGDEAERLLEFGRGSVVPQGFGWLDDQGGLIDKPAELWITCRMTHSFALGHLMGLPGYGPLIAHGIESLRGAFHDDEFGGWFDKVGTDGPTETTKSAYAHAFVLLAASSALAAGVDGAQELLDDAIAVTDKHFWDEEAGLSRESFDRSFTVCEDYRGVNANMHTVEAYLAVADVTGDRVYLDRAARIAERVVHDWARNNSWRIPEHFDAQWNVDLEFNASEPAHPFRPYGATIGHALEWARLTLTVHQALAALGGSGFGTTPAPQWMIDDSRALFDAAVADGWDVDGAQGFVYTTDWDGKPVVGNRMHWVPAEGVASAAALYAITGDEEYSRYYSQWWDYIAQYFIDTQHGSWRHELSVANEPASTTWVGKPDIYHALQVTLAPRLPVSPTFATAIERGLLA